ncbi:hypothetical protein Lal_00009952 [Lupinus albus]|uniref:Putative transcription factor C2H2 family n=1 Tax=Lupinus albus TaxID=3870 RepID=A0A6A4NH23_LUPAL|nr:putative transcription factor C2H2 family [Lupinus albus]KAF1859368.1 hypothetical protein Lal_00009952 [Lupinus albus]
MECEDHDQETSEGRSKVIMTRSYECNFCKRGFSNAQALGGHMNIHRKDKAKLKQTSTLSTQFSLDNNPQKVPQLLPLNVSLKDGVTSRDETTHVVVQIKQLPLFDDSQKPQSEDLAENNDESETRVLPCSQGSSSELDLELRLGLDPEDSSATMGTRKFF